MRDAQIGGTAGGFQWKAVPQDGGLHNGLFGQQGGVHLPRRGRSRDGDLKPAGRFRGVPNILPAVFVYENLQRIEV